VKIMLRAPQSGRFAGSGVVACVAAPLKCRMLSVERMRSKYDMIMELTERKLQFNYFGGREFF